MEGSRALASPPISILLVDDRAEDLLALEVILQRPGLRLVTASSGAEALRVVLREDFAVILLDVTMPGMQGFEVAELIKQRSRSRHIPIIFLTAESKDVASIYRGYSAGAVDYILKPIDPGVVRAKVGVFVELHRRGEEIRQQAEASLRRLSFLADASVLLSLPLDAQGIVDGLAALVTPRLCAWCVIHLRDAAGAAEQVAFAHRDEALRPLGAQLGSRPSAAPGASHGVAHVLRSGQPEVSTAPCEPARLGAALGAPHVEVVERLGAGAYVTVPLVARGQVLGAMTLVAARDERAFGPVDLAMAVDLGQRAALAVDSARLHAQVERAARVVEGG